MNRFSIAVAALLLLIVAGWQASKTHYVLIDESKIWVTGTSTIHDWTCNVGEVDGWVDADVVETLTGFSKAEITVQADGLSCKNGTMDKKARNALASDDHPIIRYTLKAAQVNATGKASFTASTTGRLTIAGETHTVTATVKGQRMLDGQLRFSTTLPITMSDYEVDPPTAMLGTLKTGDEVTVHVEAVAAPVSGM